MERRNESFQKLKPVCIALSQATLTFVATHKNHSEVTQALERLHHILKNTSNRADSLDPKLADYVFFPVSQVLKTSQDLPVQAMEACLHCLDILISRGWQDKVNPSLSGQLLIFLSLTCDTSGKTVPPHLATDELRATGFRCMHSLFKSLRSTSIGKSSLVDAANVPSLGHAISVILEGIMVGESFGIQFAAAEALSALVTCIDDMEVLSSFFPGIVSSLTKVSVPSTKSRRHWKILALNLEIVTGLLKALLSNEVTDKLSTLGDKTVAVTAQIPQANKLDSKWVSASASQLKIAIANINKLRFHERPEVKEKLTVLNLTILSECSHALKDSCTLALESLLLLFQDDSNPVSKEKVATLAQDDPSISALLATVFRNEQLSLVRVMQSNDDQAKERSLGKLFGAFQILENTDVDMFTISRMLADGLKESVVTVLQYSKDRNDPSSRVTPVTLPQLSLVRNEQKSITFSTPLAEYKSQETLLKYIQTNLKALKQAQPGFGLASSLLPSLQVSNANTQTAVFWLILQDLQTGDEAGADVLSDMLAGYVYSNDELSSCREQLYSFSLEVLEDEDADWRLKALSLEAVAVHARRYGIEFRGELMDVLYPLLHHVGSDSALVRDHAMTCLNIVSSACGYSDVADLVVSNVDYLVNAVALKLNAFDVSPQGPRVLLMMVRLAGPSLLPYLEDTLESIFAALEDYHGYPALVELLFAVLKTMAEEGVKSPLLSIKAGDEETSRKDTNDWKPTDIATLAEIIRDLANKTEDPTEAVDDLPKDKKPVPEEEEEEEEDDDEEPVSLPPPSPKTYALLLKITQLTQHYLSSSSPSLRTSLMSLIRTTMPALARHENSFLPLVNTLWPEITSRLFDGEPHVVAASLSIVAAMCESAGEFMRARIHSLWPELLALHARLRKEVGGAGGSGDVVKRAYVDVSTKTLWRQLEELLAVVVKCVRVDADKFEDVLRMLGDVDGLSGDVRAALEGYDADAVWLARYRGGGCGVIASPKSRFGFVQLAQ